LPLCKWWLDRAGRLNSPPVSRLAEGHRRRRRGLDGREHSATLDRVGRACRTVRRALAILGANQR
jgi:hypothetical protein